LFGQEWLGFAPAPVLFYLHIASAVVCYNFILLRCTMTMKPIRQTQPTGEMTPRERIWATVKGQPVDHVPYYIWLNPHTACKVIAEYKPTRHRGWNMLAKFAWKRFVKGGEFEAARIWRALPLLFDYHSFNYADAYAPELGSDIILAVPATPWHFSRINLPSMFFGERAKIKDMFGTTRATNSRIPKNNPTTTYSADTANSFPATPLPPKYSGRKTFPAPICSVFKIT